MEIILAVILFFGGFTLGSITTDRGDDDKLPTAIMLNADGAPKLRPATQARQQGDLARCHSGRTFTYRDLTVPFQDQADRQLGQAGGLVGACPDE